MAAIIEQTKTTISIVLEVYADGGELFADFGFLFGGLGEEFAELRGEAYHFFFDEIIQLLIWILSLKSVM